MTVDGSNAGAPRMISGAPLRLALVGVLVAGSSAGCADLVSAAGGCSERDERFVATLAGLPILAAHPDTATQVDASSRCDTDDGFAEAGRRYQTAMPRADVKSFYRSAATADGWQADPPGCFSKTVDGATAYFKVWFPSDYNHLGDPETQEPADVYGVEVTGSHDGEAWC
ncbi:hypothetical protein [Actinoplanes sp. HUAS TT8]|uniref:hypothetical protein n=1 Tax=Actinoplanes sp. HUAS TT8 TaxID=3447453 RepID=UPI003F5243E1